MPELTFETDTFTPEENESVLDCLLRHGKAIPYACKAGMCQACLVKAIDCEPPQVARKWIKKSMQEKGYALACQWVPEEAVEVALPSLEEFSVAVRIGELSPLNERVLRVRLVAEEKGGLFASHPGQYLSLINPAGVVRSYSIANNAERDGFIELHIGQTPQGSFSGWLFSAAQPGDSLHIRGPAGDCFYHTAEDGDNDFPIVLAGTGTGLAPLYGIVHDALQQGHRGQITLYHGSLKADSLYYVDTLVELAARHANFNYHPCPLEASAQALPGELNGSLTDLVPAQLKGSDLAHTRVFLCGNPTLVHALRKQVFLKGVKSSHIYCDPFIERAVPIKTS